MSWSMTFTDAGAVNLTLASHLIVKSTIPVTFRYTCDHEVVIAFWLLWLHNLRPIGPVSPSFPTYHVGSTKRGRSRWKEKLQICLNSTPCTCLPRITPASLHIMMHAVHESFSCGAWSYLSWPSFHCAHMFLLKTESLWQNEPQTLDPKPCTPTQ